MAEYDVDHVIEGLRTHNCLYTADLQAVANVIEDLRQKYTKERKEARRWKRRWMFMKNKCDGIQETLSVIIAKL